jgi:isopentenyl diphosphate isomerase/L-lactate dehydrogenase-like FMN-dependent dehydrogenase
MAPSNPPKPQPTKHDLSCLSIADLHRLALDRMDKQTRDYYNEGSDDNLTMNESCEAYDQYRIRPRVLRNVSNLDISVTIFDGFKNAVPFGLAPTAMQGLAHYDAELGTARASRDAGIVMGLSSFATTSLEDVREASGVNCNVLQLYLFEDRKKSKRLIERAKQAGFKAVLLTVDTPMLGRRNEDMRNQFQLPGHLKVANFDDDGTDEAEDTDQPTTPSGHPYEASRNWDGEVEIEQDWENPNVGRRRPDAMDLEQSLSDPKFTRQLSRYQHKSPPSNIDIEQDWSNPNVGQPQQQYEVEQDWSSPNVGRKRLKSPVKPGPSHRPNNMRSTRSSSTNKAQDRQKARQASVAGHHDGEKWYSPTGPITFHTHAANPTLSWEESIPWLKSTASPMQVWVKGVLTPEDAILAVQHNVDGIIVSNHGGRQLNNSISSLDALPDIVEAVDKYCAEKQVKRIPIHIDGGIRHGTDVFKALCLGADFCWIGRPVLWGLAYKGEEGVRICLRLLSDEVRLCMGLSGVKSVKECGREYLVRRGGARVSRL